MYVCMYVCVELYMLHLHVKVNIGFNKTESKVRDQRLNGDSFE